MLYRRPPAILESMNQDDRNATDSKKPYRSYLLRLWCDEWGETACWQASLDNPHTGERIGFASLEDLFAFLVELVQATGRDRE